MSLYQSMERLVNFVGDPTKITTEDIEMTSAQMPAIVICNSNQFR